MFKLIDKLQEMDFDMGYSMGSGTPRKVEKPEIFIGLKVRILDEDLIVDSYDYDNVTLYGKNCNGELYTVTLSKGTVETYI